MPKALIATKHFQATAEIRALINTLAPGESLPVASELTRTFQLSHGTVMRALKELADEGGIYRPVGKQRYLVADRFERVSARISMVRPDFPSREIDSMMQSVYTAGQSRNWKFNQHCFRNSAELDFSQIIGKADAIVLIPSSEIIQDDFIRVLLKPARPVVVLQQHLNHPQINNICADDYRVGVLAAEALAERGHRRVLFLKDQPAETSMSERRRGFVTAAARLGLDLSEELFLDSHLHSFEDSLTGSYRALSARVTDKPDFTAIFSASLSGAIAALRVAHERRLRIPEDMAVLAYGGESDLASYLHPSLSCVEIDKGELGRLTAELLETALNDAAAPARQLNLAPSLVLRESM